MVRFDRYLRTALPPPTRLTRLHAPIPRAGCAGRTTNRVNFGGAAPRIAQQHEGCPVMLKQRVVPLHRAGKIFRLPKRESCDNQQTLGVGQHTAEGNPPTFWQVWPDEQQTLKEQHVVPLGQQYGPTSLVQGFEQQAPPIHIEPLGHSCRTFRSCCYRFLDRHRWCHCSRCQCSRCHCSSGALVALAWGGFVIPVVVNGRVYFGARGEIEVYGLLK